MLSDPFYEMLPSIDRQLVEALMFLVNSHPNIYFAINTLSQHMVEPRHSHWIGAKNLLGYAWGTITHGLRYTAGNVTLLGCTDANWAGNVEDRKSTSRCCFSLGSADILDEQEVDASGSKHRRGRIHCC